LRSPFFFFFFFFFVLELDLLWETDGIKRLTVKSDRIRYWISVGAQPTDIVKRILGKVGAPLPSLPPCSTCSTCSTPWLLLLLLLLLLLFHPFWVA